MRLQFTFQTLKEYICEKYRRISDKDLQGFIADGKLPDYMGNIEIKKGKQKLKGGISTFYIFERQ